MGACTRRATPRPHTATTRLSMSAQRYESASRCPVSRFTVWMTLSSALNCTLLFFCGQKGAGGAVGLGDGGGGMSRPPRSPPTGIGCWAWPAARACVSWKERMTTTGWRCVVTNRSLICALTSLSPATWVGGGVGVWVGGGRGGNKGAG